MIHRAAGNEASKPVQAAVLSELRKTSDEQPLDGPERAARVFWVRYVSRCKQGSNFNCCRKVETITCMDFWKNAALIRNHHAGTFCEFVPWNGVVEWDSHASKLVVYLRILLQLLFPAGYQDYWRSNLL